MSNWNLLKGVAAASLMTAAIVAPAQAQTTSSSVTGQITDETGAAVANAAVSITHTPTNTTKSATTSANGVFFATGLPIGGPYIVTANTDTLEGQLNDVFLRPSSNSLNLALVSKSEEMELDAIVITASANALSVGDGVGSAYSSDEILSQPSPNRDLIDTLVRDPLAFSSGEGILTIAGTNPRFNALAIDGALQQDDFGLGSNTYATNRSPVSLDAIESATVSAADYNVTVSGFTGGLVNVNLKTGTNEFDGAVYYYRQDEDYFGNVTEGTLVETAPFLEEEMGFVVSGPIIKDKLFFMVNYDEFTSGSSSNFTQADIDDFVNPDIYDAVNQIVLDTYGYDMGGRPNVVSNPVTSDRLIAKLDWNVNDFHRASFTYQKNEESEVNGVGQSTYTSAYYQSPRETTAYKAQLFSDWSNQLSSELRLNYKEFAREQTCNAGTSIGFWDIQLSEADLVGTDLEGFLDDGDDNTAETSDVLFLEGGCDRFRQGNTFEDSRLQLFGAANYVYGDHLITAGAEFQTYELDNLFAQRSVGLFRYENIADLQAGLADSVQVQLPDSGVQEDIRAVWGYNTIALFVQDSWQIRPDLRVDYGLRYEHILQDDEPQERTFFADRYGFSNTENLDGNNLIMPRVSFEYTPFDRTKLTGGFGLFGGGDPKVWTSNAFTPPVFFASASDVAGTNPANGTPQTLLDIITANSANDPGPIDVISPDFETPSDWKASLRLDQEFDLNFKDQIGIDLGEGYQASFQLLYTNSNKGFRWENLAQTQNVTDGEANTLPLGVAPDGRPIYADLANIVTDATEGTTGINNAIALTNSDGGSSLALSASLSKDYDNGFGFFASYAWQDAEQVTEGGSSRGVSNFRGIIDSDRNNPSAGTSPYQTEHAFKVNLSYETEVFEGLESKFNLFGQFFSGEPFSYTFNTDQDNALFGRSGDGESPFDNDLLYVPTISNGAISDSRVVLADGFDEDAFIDFVNERGLGQGIVERHSDESPWTQRWDFQYQQELPFFNDFASNYVGDNKLNFVVDIRNIANLLNDEWGTAYNGPGFDTASLVTADLVSAADVAANGVDAATALEGDAARLACTTAEDCVYRFNDFRFRQSGFKSLTGSVYEIRLGLRYEF